MILILFSENDYPYKRGKTFELSIYDFVASLNLNVFGCGVIPGGQTSTRTFTASGPSNLPIIAVYTENKATSALVPGIATSKEAVQALGQRFAMQTVVDVLEIEGRRALLPDFVISNILSQLQVNTTYEPLRCQIFMEPGGTRKSSVVDIHLENSNPNYKGYSKSMAALFFANKDIFYKLIINYLRI
ncbi:hypothetical protein KIN20_021347 [Parelaphostrongylus tenuis]|uniref:Uncharacterized protein n=1 Tax=Parelaphostrongylus tenuis TaxID=148309 RepID=A0AAD5N7U4_PARTN|nr:hypothetical protein KIN20_021347 [Parelaphostrongylus tenuis]